MCGRWSVPVTTRIQQVTHPRRVGHVQLGSVGVGSFADQPGVSVAEGGDVGGEAVTRKRRLPNVSPALCRQPTVGRPDPQRVHGRDRGHRAAREPETPVDRAYS